MRRRLTREIPVVVLALGIWAFAACGSSTGPIDDRDILAGTDLSTDVSDTSDISDIEEAFSSNVEDWIEEGKRQLRDGESGFAIKAFEEALALEPDHTDALFGKALAELVYGSELYVMALSLPSQFMSEPDSIGLAARGSLAEQYATVASALEPPPDDWSQNEYLANELHRIFMRIREYFVAAIEKLERIEGRELQFAVEAVPVYLGIKPMITYRGVFDGGDAYIMSAVANTVVGVTDVLAGQDLTTDVLTLVGLVKEGLDSGKVDAKKVLQYAAYLLNQDERFLTLHAEDGEFLFEDARDRFAAAGPDLSAGIDLAREEGPEEDQVSWVEDTAGQHVLKVRSRVFYDLEGESYEEVMVFHFTGAIIEAFEDASESILNADKPVTLHGAVLPILAVMLSLASQTGVMDAVGLELPIDIGAFEIPGVVTLLQSLLPNVMAFDWGGFFANPVGLRAWLPVITSDQPVFQNNVLVEWECPDDLKEDGFPSGSLDILCSGDAELVDSAHFVGTEQELEADGIPSGFPVFAFDDPTLNGLVRVDLDGVMGSTDTGTYESADGTSLNAALAKVLEGVLALIP